MSPKEWVELGCLGILAFMLWYERKFIIPKAFETHASTIASLNTKNDALVKLLTDTFKDSLTIMIETAKEEARSSRTERKQSAEYHKHERDADRQSRHQQAQVLQLIVGQLQLHKGDET